MLRRPASSRMKDENASGLPRPDESETVRLGKPVLAFNRYELLRELGKGGTGVVWLARDSELNAKVALKFLREDVTFEGDALKELKGEVILNRGLSHPHIIKTYSFETSGPKAAISMEHVDGDNLQKLKAQQPGKFFEVEDIQRWMLMLCDAMHYAHRQNVVHRDLKPSNLIINWRGELKVGDFGIGRAVAETVSRITMNVTGTPPYMSPQQTMGEKATRADDIYSIGATIYDLLTGTPPFFRGAIREQTLAKVPPSMAARRRELGRAGKPIPLEWERAVAACLAKEPAARPPTAQELGKILAGHAGASVLSSYPVARSGIKGIFWALACLALTAAIGVIWNWKDPTQVDRLIEVIAGLRQRLASEPAEAPIPAPVPKIDSPMETSEQPMAPLPAGGMLEQLDEKIRPLFAAGNVTTPEAEWLQAALKGTQGEAEQLLARRLLDSKTISLGHWRARTGCDFSLAEVGGVDSTRLPPALDLQLDERTKLRLIRVNSGSFFRGSPREELGRRPNEAVPERILIERPFFLGAFEITQAEYNALMPRDPSFWRGNPTWPVDQIDWQSVAGPNGFIARLNRLLAGKYAGSLVADLPSEEEWEYACRAGARTAFNSGANITSLENDRGLDLVANYGRAIGGAPRPVGSLQPNAWGFFDMHGNVAEWCQNRFQRGGSWYSTAANCRAAWRTQLSANASPSNQVGFRVVIRHRSLAGLN